MQIDFSYIAMLFNLNNIKYCSQHSPPICDDRDKCQQISALRLKIKIACIPCYIIHTYIQTLILFKQGLNHQDKNIYYLEKKK